MAYQKEVTYAFAVAEQVHKLLSKQCKSIQHCCEWESDVIVAGLSGDTGICETRSNELGVVSEFGQARLETRTSPGD